MRSMLFVPGDSEKKLAKAAQGPADALILDLEDSVAPDRKAAARTLARAALDGARGRQQLWVRINPVDGREALADLAAVVGGRPDGIVLPKAAGAETVRHLDYYLSALETRDGLAAGAIKVIVIATETGAAMFGLGSYAPGTPRLAGLTWGAEDLAAAVGASSNSDVNGLHTPLYILARSLCLAASAAADSDAIDSVYTKLGDTEGLRAVCAAARRDGFRGKMAIHPEQVALINEMFSPSAEEIAEARKICDAFAAAPGIATLRLDGRMLDLPHLKQAQRILARLDH